jgi:hypothetical protein
MKTSSRAAGAGRSKFYYKCPTKGEGHAFQTAQPIEDLIAETVIGRLDQPGVIARLAGPQDQGQQHRLQQEAVALRERLDEAANSFADGLITAKQMEAVTTRVQSKLETLDMDLAAAARSALVPASASDDVRAWWESAGIERQRAVIDALMVPIVDPIRKSAPRTFDPDRIRIEWRTA